jgi:hypothetical protein
MRSTNLSALSAALFSLLKALPYEFAALHSIEVLPSCRAGRMNAWQRDRGAIALLPAAAVTTVATSATGPLRYSHL